MIRAVIFDLDGTLVDRDAASERWFRSVVQSRPDLFPMNRWTEAVTRFMALDEHGYNDRAQFGSDVLEAFPGLSESTSMFWYEFTSGLAACVETEPKVRALLDRLRARIPVAILTNGSLRTQRAKLRAAQLDHLTTFVSEEIGVDKPDPAAFAHVLKTLKIDRPADALFVGDDPVRDMQGARAAGLQTCWVSRGRTWTLCDFKPDRTITHVAELEGFEELRG